jgi:hypothetical protein
VAVVFFGGYSMVWAGLLVVSLHSDREGVSNNKGVVGVMVTTWILFVLGHVLIHEMAVRTNVRKHEYSTRTTPEGLSDGARAHMWHRAIPGTVLVMFSLFLMTFYGTAIHTFHLPEVPTVGYLSVAIAWGLLLKVRLRHSEDQHRELAAFICAVPFWLVGWSIALWDMSTGTE